MKNPKWQRDEVILALDLYFELNRKNISATNPKIIALSSLLNHLPINREEKIRENFRNPNGVSLKLSNFLAIDPDNNGKGMDAYSKLDEKVFFEFYQKREILSALAKQIRLIVNNDFLSQKLLRVQFEDSEANYREGTVSYRLHLYRERNKALVRKKKDDVLKKGGKLVCEVCGFDFEKQYGNLGRDFIECHHIVPLSEQGGEQKTRLKDLVLVCPNCHRMLHRGDNILSVDELKEIVTCQ